MAKRKTAEKKIRVSDFTSWNFILFLTLAFILLVVMLNAMSRMAFDVRSRAGLACPEVTLPRAEDCPGGWKYQRDATNGCPTFICDAQL